MTPVARYHSLAVDAATLPECLTTIAHTEDGEVMARHSTGTTPSTASSSIRSPS